MTLVFYNGRNKQTGKYLWAVLPVPIQVLEVISLILVFLSMPILLFFERRWLIHPLKRLTGAIKIIEKGDLDYRIEETAKAWSLPRSTKALTA